MAKDRLTSRFSPDPARRCTEMESPFFQNMADVELRTPDGRTATLTDER